MLLAHSVYTLHANYTHTYTRTYTYAHVVHKCMYVYVSVCNSDYLSTRCVLAELAKSSKQATPNGPKQALQTLSATAAATTTQNGHKKMKISTLEIMRQTSLKHAASPTTGWANKEHS